MPSPIGTSIAARIEGGLDVDQAYRLAAIEIADKLIETLDRGGAPNELLVSVGVPNGRKIVIRLLQLGGLDHYNRYFDRRNMYTNMYIVVAGGDIDSVPKAECVARRLRGKSNPTRRDIEEAFAACARE